MSQLLCYWLTYLLLNILLTEYLTCAINQGGSICLFNVLDSASEIISIFHMLHTCGEKYFSYSPLNINILWIDNTITSYSLSSLRNFFFSHSIALIEAPFLWEALQKRLSSVYRHESCNGYERSKCSSSSALLKAVELQWIPSKILRSLKSKTYERDWLSAGLGLVRLRRAGLSVY